MRKIGMSLMRASALAIALLTSASLVLHPGSLKATDYWVDPYDRDPDDSHDGSNRCGFLQITKICGRAADGGFSGWLTRNTGIKFNGGGGYSMHYEKDCSSGTSRTCEYRNDCKGSPSKIAYFQPDCTITIR